MNGLHCKTLESEHESIFTQEPEVSYFSSLFIEIFSKFYEIICFFVFTMWSTDGYHV